MPEIPLFARGGASELTLQELLAAVHELRDNMPDPGQGGGGTSTSTVALDAATITALTTALETVTVSGSVALAPASLAALESIAATISNLPTDYPDVAVATALGSLLAAIEALPAPQTDGLTRAQLDAAPVVVDTGLTIPEPWTDGLTREQLDESPLGVSVHNLPTTYPLPAAQVEQLTPPTPPSSVGVSNLPTTYPLPADQVAALAAPATQAVTIAQELNVADSGEREYVSVPFTVTAAGPTVLYTPEPGKAIRLRKIKAIQDPTTGVVPVIRVFLGTYEYARGLVVAERQRRTGAPDGPLTITLDVAGRVVGTAFLEEI